MCGITGFYGSSADFDLSLLQAMNDCQCHRGPDGVGTFTDGPVGFAHQRLAILGRAHGDQPMTTNDGRFTIIYNGETYNYRQLREELTAAGYTFTTETDTEVVLKGFAHWGTAVFDRMNGMWGLAIWDRDEQRLVLSRDHFGIKPLYIARVGDDVLFSSELKGILASDLIEAKPNERSIYRYLRFRIHEDSRETFFQGIERVSPGEMVTIDSAGVRFEPHTRFVDELREAAQLNRPYSAEVIHEYRQRLVESVRERLQSEVPVGTSLSGGLDSSAVAVIINQLLGSSGESAAAVGSKQNTFSAVFTGSINDEERYVDAVLEKCDNGVQSHKIRPTPDQFKVDLIDFIRTQEEPTISTGPYAQYCVMKEASQHVKVLLDGQGADEMMAGYIPYYFTYFRQLKKEGRYTKLATEVAKSVDVLGRLGRFTVKDKLKRRQSVPITSLLNADFTEQYRDEKFTTVQDNLKERLIEDLFHNSLPSLLRYEDRNTMRFSLEGRVPFLDRDTVRFLFSLSDDAIIESGWNKRILRDATRHILPEMISNRRNKIGFTTPENEWFMRLKNSIYSVFASKKFASRPWFDQQAVLNAFMGYINGDNDLGSMTFWRLLNVELWTRIFIDEDDDFSGFSSAASDVSDLGASAPADEKAPLAANAGKELDIEVDGVIARRYPIQTEKFSKDSNMDAEVTKYVKEFFTQLKQLGDEDDHNATEGRTWNLTISEKIIAIMQGRSWFTWEIQPSFAAKNLSKFVARTPVGIGLGDPVTMQLAIEEAGLPRILYAAAGGAIGKVVGRKGLFYELAGADIRAIDGPTEYSVYPSNVSAKLPPKDPDGVARHLSDVVRQAAPEEFRATFDGVVVMDANDIGRNVLGLHASQPAEHYEKQFADNPLGQASQQTPLAIVFER